jgi:hypothetical protein
LPVRKLAHTSVKRLALEAHLSVVDAYSILHPAFEVLQFGGRAEQDPDTRDRRC